MGPVAYDENEREFGCPYRELYLHDGGEYYLCRIDNNDCYDNHSEKVEGTCPREES